MNIDKIKLFKSQPKLNKVAILGLTNRGLLVPQKSPRQRATCTDEITNSNAGEVVSYRPLDQLLRGGKISQDDARRLLVIEATRQNGRPRQSHISRLMVVAFAEDKTAVLDRIEEVRKETWEKKA